MNIKPCFAVATLALASLPAIAATTTHVGEVVSFQVISINAPRYNQYYGIIIREAGKDVVSGSTAIGSPQVAAMFALLKLAEKKGETVKLTTCYPPENWPGPGAHSSQVFRINYIDLGAHHWGGYPYVEDCH
jgi:hypothetical protein